MNLFILDGIISLDAQTTYRLSPAHPLSLQVGLSPLGAPFYVVCYHGDTIIAPSYLGVIVDNIAYVDHFVMDKPRIDRVDSIVRFPWGANKQVRDQHLHLQFVLRHIPTHKQLIIHFKIHPDGVAFCYEIPWQNDTIVTMDEYTEMRVAGNPRTWWSWADFNTYEKEYYDTPLDSASWVATPVVMRRADSLCLALNESAIVRYPDMTLKQDSTGCLKVALTPWKNGDKVYIRTPFITPWRMITVGKNDKDLVSSSTMLLLAPPAKIDCADYCKPMKYIGIWWAFHLGIKEWKEGDRQGATTEEAIRYIDFAAARHIDGVLVEGWNTGWQDWGKIGAFDWVTPASHYDLRKVAEYARQKGVRLIMHHETGGDIENYENQMDSAFKLCVELGISAVKTGHAGPISTGENHHGQQVVEHFEKVVQTAARYHIALDMHEPIKGSGLERTYPNFMTREAVRGLEWEAWSKGNTPSYTTLLPFTRGLAGPVDYTPGIFDILFTNAPSRIAWNAPQDFLSETRVHSTITHQLALMVTLYSPWVMAADLIENYDHPLFSFVEDFNPDYDESLILDARIGEYILLARRSADKWFIAATTNETARQVNFSLDFLGEGLFQLTIYKDGKAAHWQTNPTDYMIEEKRCTASDSLSIDMAAGGGFAIVAKKL